MTDHDRRTFLKRAAGAVAATGSLPLVGCEPEAPAETSTGAGRTSLDRGVLDPMAAEVLPVGALGPEGLARVVDGFVAWLDAYEPVAELDHAYLTDELRFAPAHPAPRWTADLQALDLEAVRRHELAFAELSKPLRRALLDNALAGADDGFPPPARAGHVALGLMAWFYASSGANDLCYQARIGRHECRGIDSLPEEPEGVEAGP